MSLCKDNTTVDAQNPILSPLYHGNYSIMVYEGHAGFLFIIMQYTTGLGAYQIALLQPRSTRPTMIQKPAQPFDMFVLSLDGG